MSISWNPLTHQWELLVLLDVGQAVSIVEGSLSYVRTAKALMERASAREN